MLHAEQMTNPRQLLLTSTLVALAAAYSWTPVASACSPISGCVVAAKPFPADLATDVPLNAEVRVDYTTEGSRPEPEPQLRDANGNVVDVMWTRVADVSHKAHHFTWVGKPRSALAPNTRYELAHGFVECNTIDAGMRQCALCESSPGAVLSKFNTGTVVDNAPPASPSLAPVAFGPIEASVISCGRIEQCSFQVLVNGVEANTMLRLTRTGKEGARYLHAGELKGLVQQPGTADVGSYDAITQANGASYAVQAVDAAGNASPSVTFTVADCAWSAFDGGTVVPDGGTVSPDASTAGPRQEDREGCSLSRHGSQSGLLVSALAVLLRNRRRSRAKTSTTS